MLENVDTDAPDCKRVFTVSSGNRIVSVKVPAIPPAMRGVTMDVEGGEDGIGCMGKRTEKMHARKRKKKITSNETPFHTK